MFSESLSESEEYDITTATETDDEGDVGKRKRKDFPDHLTGFVLVTSTEIENKTYFSNICRYWYDTIIILRVINSYIGLRCLW